MSEPVLCAVGLGSNLGDREAHLASAVARLSSEPGLEVVGVSEWMENAAVGGPPGQPDYLNGACLVRTALSAEELLACLIRIEADHGRDRSHEEHHGPRTLDLDLLVHGRTIVRSHELCVPHPRMLERDFVLTPLAAIAPGLELPHTGRSVREEAARLAGER